MVVYIPSSTTTKNNFAQKKEKGERKTVKTSKGSKLREDKYMKGNKKSKICLRIPLEPSLSWSEFVSSKSRIYILPLGRKGEAFSAFAAS